MVIIVWCDVRAVTVLDTLQLNDFSFYGLHQLICCQKAEFRILCDPLFQKNKGIF